MPVESRLSGTTFPVPGVKGAAIAAGVRYANRLDLVMFELAEGSRVAGMFTLNAFCAAPVAVSRKHLQQGDIRYLLINTGNANAGTGRQGLEDAQASCTAVAEAVKDATGVTIEAHQVLPFSTGVIGERLPVQRIIQGIPQAIEQLNDEPWEAASRGIMTTDTRPKATSVRVDLGSGEQVTITGIAKGAGMIKPNMATMLAFVFTDAAIEQVLLDQLLKEVVNQSFNRITVDGDTSTNDSCLLVATGQSGHVVDSGKAVAFAAFRTALGTIFQQLAMELIRDAEGANKFVTIKVTGGATSQECLDVAYTIAESPLVKTALFASDPNWGRILAAVGRAGLQDLVLDRISIFLGDTRLVENGGVAASYTEQQGKAEMAKTDITITIDLARGESEETVWTCDLSNDYVRINADYRS